eukprot:5932630-Amphidinium_carterae.1
MQMLPLLWATASNLYRVERRLIPRPASLSDVTKWHMRCCAPSELALSLSEILVGMYLVSVAIA